MARKIAVIDSETDPFKKHRIPKPFIWGYFDGQSFQLFNDVQTLCEFLSKKRIIVYAHNGGKFDFHFLLDQLDPYQEVRIINGRLAQAHIGKCELRDSFNILPVPLKAYKKDDIDYSIMEEDERNKPENREKIVDYLRGDCVYLYELIMKFVERFGLHLTQAGASMAQWKKISQRDAPQTDQTFYETFAPYYYGGRVECFEHGIIDTHFKVYDINSAYPRAMMEPHPYSPEYEHSTRYMKDADFVRVRCVSTGALPYRGIDELGLSFPHDDETREYTVSGWEYRLGKDTGTIRKDKVIESFRFAEHVSFEEYVEHFYQMRLIAKASNDDATSLFAKLFMNSLYGKFAANPDNYNNYILIPASRIADLAGSGWEFGGELGDWILGEAPLADFQKRYYNVATGASITGYVRAMLWNAIQSSDGVLYCDTDSIAVRKAGAAVTLGDSLGQWKDEGEFDRAGIAGKKLYIFQGCADAQGKRTYKTASKGARLSHSELWEVASGDEITFTPEVPTFSMRKAPVFTSRRIVKTAG